MEIDKTPNFEDDDRVSLFPCPPSALPAAGELPLLQHSHSQPVITPNFCDRFIPMRGNQNEIELKDLLMDISLDESGMKKNESNGNPPTILTQQLPPFDRSEFKSLLATQLVGKQRPGSQQKVLHKTLSQTSRNHEPQLLHSNTGILPQKILSFKKETYTSEIQDEEGRLILNDRVFLDQF